MKTSILQQNEIPSSVVELVQRMVERIPWPARRQAMADATKTLLKGKPRVAEAVFGWGRSTVELGMNELRTGIACLNDLSERRKPRTEEKYPRLLVDLRKIMDPRSQAESHLRTSFSYTNMTAEAVGAIGVAGEGMAEGNGSDRTNPFKYLESPRLQASKCGQNSGPKKRNGPTRSSRM